MNTLEVEVNGKKYVIKKWLLKDRKELVKLGLTSNVGEVDMEKLVDIEANIIFFSVVEPKFNSVEEVFELPQEVADELFYHIILFNRPKRDFLGELKNSF